MKSMTVRGIDPKTAEALRIAAKKKGKSINQIAIESIKESLGISKAANYTRTYDDLDSLFGKWSQEEFERIQQKIDDERVIDEELWQ